MDSLLDKQVTLIALFSLFFVAGLFCLIILLTMLRQIRHHRQVILAELPPQPAKVQTGTTRLVTSTQQMVRVTPIPQQWRIPIQEGSPNQVILSIVPQDDIPDSSDHHNVQKLIDFLKREAVQKAS